MRPREIDVRDVMGFLRRHPDFLDEHPEALRLLRPPTREIGEGVVDFQQFLYERQRRELNRVNIEYRNLIAVSRGNLASQNRVHKAALTILAAPSFGQLLQTVTTDLAVLLDVDVVTIAVENIAGIAPRLNGTASIRWKRARSRPPARTRRGSRPMSPATRCYRRRGRLVRSQALLRLRFDARRQPACCASAPVSRAASTPVSHRAAFRPVGLSIGHGSIGAMR